MGEYNWPNFIWGLESGDFQLVLILHSCLHCPVSWYNGRIKMWMDTLKRNRVELQIFMNYEKSDVIGYKTEQSDGKKVTLMMI